MLKRTKNEVFLGIYSIFQFYSAIQTQYQHTKRIFLPISRQLFIALPFGIVIIINILNLMKKI